MAKLRRVYKVVSRPIKDFFINTRLLNVDTGRLLVLRNARKRPGFYDQFLHFLEQEHPNVRGRIELGLVSGRRRDWSRYALCVPWVQDPVRETDCQLYLDIRRLESQCRSYGIPVANSVNLMSNSVKTTAARIMASVGSRIARAEPVGPQTVQVVSEELGYPFFIRENLRHGGHIFLVEAYQDLALIEWERFRCPCAVQYIDTRGADGLFRKYRYLSGVGFGAPLNLMISRHWVVRRDVDLQTDDTIQEDIAYAERPDPFGDELDRVRKALGFDFCAFDYSIDRHGGLVIWEANPYPDLPLLEGEDYRHRYMKRGYAVMACSYLCKAGLKIPDALMQETHRGMQANTVAA